MNKKWQDPNSIGLDVLDIQLNEIEKSLFSDSYKTCPVCNTQFIVINEWGYKSGNDYFCSGKCYLNKEYLYKTISQNERYHQRSKEYRMLKSVIIELFNQKLNPKQIADEIGISTLTVNSMLKSVGFISG